MRKLIILILLLCAGIAQGQTTYQLNYDSIRVNKTAGTGGTSLYGKVYLKNVSAGLTSDSMLVIRNGRIFKVLKTNGTVTSVSGTSPISVATGTTTPVISMTPASAVNEGYMTIGTQTIAGAKTLTGNTISAGTMLVGNITPIANAGSGSMLPIEIAGTTGGTGIAISDDNTSLNAETYVAGFLRSGAVVGKVGVLAFRKSQDTTGNSGYYGIEVHATKHINNINYDRFGWSFFADNGMAIFPGSGTDSFAPGYKIHRIYGYTATTSFGVGTPGTDSIEVHDDFSKQTRLIPATYYAPTASPTFTGIPAAPTATAGTNTTQLATTAFVTTAVGGATIALSAIGATPNANGATITGSTLNLQPASASFGGVVTTGDQTIAGDKTLTGRVLINGSSTEQLQVLTTAAGFAITGTASTISNSIGVAGYANVSGGTGVFGQANAANGRGVYGSVNGSGYGVYGQATAGGTGGFFTTSTGEGIFASASSSGIIARFANSTTSANIFTINPASVVSTVSISSTPQGTLYGTATGSITSAQLATSLTNETGTGVAVFSASPTFTGTVTSPNFLGTASGFTFNADQGSYYKNREANGPSGNPTWENTLNYGVSNTSYGSVQFGNEYQAGLKTSYRVVLHNGTSAYVPLSIDGGTGAAIISGTLGINGTANNVTSGTYTPTITGVTNFNSSTAYVMQFMRVGNTVTASGQVGIQASATGVVEFRITLPISSNIAATGNLGGSGVFDITGTAPAGIKGDVTNDAAAFFYTAANTGMNNLFFSFTYQVL